MTRKHTRGDDNTAKTNSHERDVADTRVTVFLATSKNGQPTVSACSVADDAKTTCSPNRRYAGVSSPHASPPPWLPSATLLLHVPRSSTFSCTFPPLVVTQDAHDKFPSMRFTGSISICAKMLR